MSWPSERHVAAAYRYGAGMAKVRPARVQGKHGDLVICGRPLGLNPFDIWASDGDGFDPLYEAFNDGYRDATAARLT